MKPSSLYRILFCSSLALLSLSACGPQEKPTELVQLEELRKAEESAAINGSAPEAYRECTDLTNKAIDAWQGGEQSKAKLYAALGQRQYATARSKASLADADKRQEAAQKEIDSLKKQMETLRAQQEGLEKNIATMKETISNSDLSNVEHRIQIAMMERDKAASVEAPLTQKATFDAAEKKLKEAGENNALGKRKEASAAAEESRLMFQKAYEDAKPEFDKKQVDAAFLERQKVVVSKAQSIVGQSCVFTDMRNTVIVLAAAFDKNKSELLPVKRDALKRIADLIKENPNATITIEGHTQKSTSNDYDVSQRRCDSARNFLISQGIDRNAIMTTAKGKEIQRYDEKKKANRPLNDRLEIIITLP